VEGLNQDWCISRQRFFGVPFPVWYSINNKGQVNYTDILIPEVLSFFKNKSQPVDPVHSAPADWNPKLKHYTEDKRGNPGGFIADLSVMDTWASSSLSPQINSQWLLNNEYHQALFPADLRPQAHEIIRTWAFYTIVKTFFHSSDFAGKLKKDFVENKSIPWKHVAVSGWVMSPERLKISKSGGKESTVSPERLLQLYGADAVRYWAGKARLGQDTVFDENMIKNGKRLSTKLQNAFKFVQIQTQNLIDMDKQAQSFPGLLESMKQVNAVLDRSWINHLLNIHQTATKHLKELDHASALNHIEKAFWLFCDNYLELVKGRVYQLKEKESGRSGVRALDISLYFFIKMLAPYMPFVTEDIWRQRYNSIGSGVQSENAMSVHIHPWQVRKTDREWIPSWKLSIQGKELLSFSFFILQKIRSFKASRQKSLSTKVKQFEMKVNQQQSDMFGMCREDLIRAGGLDSDNISLTVVKKKENNFSDPLIVLEG